VSIPVIGCGGIVSASDALEFIMAGASAVQVGTASFTDPHAPLEVVEGIERFMEREGVERLTDLIGIAQR
jgi:dihydroorotate dehydrogenase (NAD+) catalytic subunit